MTQMLKLSYTPIYSELRDILNAALHAEGGSLVTIDAASMSPSDRDIVIHWSQELGYGAYRPNRKKYILVFEKGYFSVNDKLPVPDIQLCVECADESGNILCGGAAMYGKDGRWYWTHNRRKAKLIRTFNGHALTVTHWDYLEPQPIRRANP